MSRGVWIEPQVLYVAYFNIGNAPQLVAPFATFAIYAVIAISRKDETLLGAQAFASRSLIALMTQPLVMFCQAWPQCTQAAACFTRIQEFLQLEQASLLPITSSFECPDGSVTMETLESPTAPTGSVISLEHADISWSPGSELALRDISLIIRPGFTAIIGPVASGKSTLLSAMLGDAILKGGSISPRLSAVAFCSQTPWIHGRHNTA